MGKSHASQYANFGSLQDTILCAFVGRKMLSFGKLPVNKYAFCSFGTLRTICLSITLSFSGHELKLGVRVNNT